MSSPVRCPWAQNHSLLQHYHDTQWGIPLHDDLQLFKMLNLEGQQAGLSWLTILAKMEGYEQAFARFDPSVLITYTDQHVEQLMQNSGIIKNRLKIQAIIHNARIYLKTVEQYGSFDAFIWRYVDNKPVINYRKTASEVPATSPLSDLMSKELKKQGFKFVGSTTLYAFMQATGMVNDHLISCFCHPSFKDQAK